ncbi:hypothetical protein K8R78_08655 [bacterium]|nr:hypothetical protein [bacterium]
MGKLRLIYGEFELALADGEKLCVVGESGSGRSLLCRLMSGVLVGSEVSLRLDGEPYSLPDDSSEAGQPAGVGFLPFPVPPLAAPPELERELAALLKLQHLLKRPGPYSAGENARLQLGAALSRHHRFLILDQPLALLGGRDYEETLTLLLKDKRGILLTSARPLPGWSCLQLGNDLHLPPVK